VLATVSGTLVVQCSPHRAQALALDIAEAIDSSKLNRIGDVVVREGEGFAELAVPISYGPVFGAYESDLRRFALPVARRLDVAFEIFKAERRILDQASLPQVIAELEAKADDLTVTLAQRKVFAERALSLAKLAQR
jgi:hypothetical protein